MLLNIHVSSRTYMQLQKRLPSAYTQTSCITYYFSGNPFSIGVALQRSGGSAVRHTVTIYRFRRYGVTQLYHPICRGIQYLTLFMWAICHLGSRYITIVSLRDVWRCAKEYRLYRCLYCLCSISRRYISAAIASFCAVQITSRVQSRI